MTRSSKQQQQKEREKKESERKKERFRTAKGEEIGGTLGEVVYSEEGASCSKDEDPDYVPSKYLRKPKKLDTVMLELPTKDLAKNTADLLDRLKVSHSSATSLFAKIILSGGGDLHDFVISKTTFWRQRIIGEKQAEKKLKLKSEALSEKNLYGILHFDGKKVQFNSREVHERLVICLQQVDSEEIPKFLGAPQTENGKGAAQY